MDNSIENLRTLSPGIAEKLKELGINTIEEFYEIAKFKDSRLELSKKIDVDEFTIEGWSADAGNHILMANCKWS